jgi:hypothetical protein
LAPDAALADFMTRLDHGKKKIFAGADPSQARRLPLIIPATSAYMTGVDVFI